MKFTVTDEVAYPRQAVFEAHRDHLVDLLPYLPNIDRVIVEERVEDGQVVRLLNHWYGASSDVPAPLRPVIRPDMLSWVDRAEWDMGKWRCSWNITLMALPDAVTARGLNVFRDEGGCTVIQNNGEFILHPERIPGVPSFLAKQLAPALERFVVGLLEPNLRKSNDAVRRYLDERGG